MKVSVIGGTGFVGSYIVDRLIAAEHTPRLLVRQGSEGKVVQRDACEIVPGDIDDSDALKEVMSGARAMIYLPGILREFPSRGITFEAIQYQGFSNALEAARDSGIGRIILMSANGVDAGATSYQRTKHHAEELLAESDCQWTVFRPSVIFGDPRGRMEFCTQLKHQLVDPPIPAAVFFPGLNVLAAGKQEMNPVHVDNVAQAFVASVDTPASYGRIFELGGPNRVYWRDIIRTIAWASGRDGKWLLPAPAWGVRSVAKVFQRFDWFPLTADQVTLLMQGNIANASEIAGMFKIDLTPFDSKHLDYLKDPGRAIHG